MAAVLLKQEICNLLIKEVEFHLKKNLKLVLNMLTTLMEEAHQRILTRRRRDLTQLTEM